MSELSDKTVKNYDGYLSGWVKWLDERCQESSVVINDSLLTAYLAKRFKDGKYDSYMRVGRAIRDFMNLHLDTRITLQKPVGFKRDFEHV